jgi:hypothetical protein
MLDHRVQKTCECLSVWTLTMECRGKFTPAPAEGRTWLPGNDDALGARLK